MKTSNKIQDNKFQISIGSNHSVEDLKDWNVTVMKVLLLAKGTKATLITITPQSYSICEGLGNFQKIKRNKGEYLLNWNVLLSEENLSLIAESEEFRRGLLFIVLSASITDIFDTIDVINSVGVIDLSQLTVGIIVLEDDGETLTWNYPNKKIQESLLDL